MLDPEVSIVCLPGQLKPIHETYGQNSPSSFNGCTTREIFSPPNHANLVGFIRPSRNVTYWYFSSNSSLLRISFQPEVFIQLKILGTNKSVGMRCRLQICDENCYHLFCQIFQESSNIFCFLLWISVGMRKINDRRNRWVVTFREEFWESNGRCGILVQTETQSDTSIWEWNFMAWELIKMNLNPNKIVKYSVYASNNPLPDVNPPRKEIYKKFKAKVMEWQYL